MDFNLIIFLKIKPRNYLQIIPLEIRFLMWCPVW